MDDGTDSDRDPYARARKSMRNVPVPRRSHKVRFTPSEEFEIRASLAQGEEFSVRMRALVLGHLDQRPHPQEEDPPPLEGESPNEHRPRRKRKRQGGGWLPGLGEG